MQMFTVTAETGGEDVAMQRCNENGLQNAVSSVSMAALATYRDDNNRLSDAQEIVVRIIPRPDLSPPERTA